MRGADGIIEGRSVILIDHAPKLGEDMIAETPGISGDQEIAATRKPRADAAVAIVRVKKQRADLGHVSVTRRPPQRLAMGIDEKIQKIRACRAARLDRSAADHRFRAPILKGEHENARPACKGALRCQETLGEQGFIRRKTGETSAGEPREFVKFFDI